jgi:MoxR-like ATPase
MEERRNTETERGVEEIRAQETVEKQVMRGESREPALEAQDPVRQAERLADATQRMKTELRKAIVGQEEVVEQVLLTLFTGGNSLIVGVPGLAKTLLVASIARVLDLKFSRIQFTPDLMPSDITGTDIIQEDADTGRRQLVFMPGPLFANVVLADEINRTPPKTQAALLEAMQEHRITIQGRTYELEEPFFVLATQNPIELEGTYPLPEAQLDRFMFEIVIDYLPEDEELEVVLSTTAEPGEEIQCVVTGDEILAFQTLVRKVPVSEAVARYAIGLARATRPREAEAPDFIREFVSYGASVRAAQHLVLGGKARALVHGTHHVSFEDIRALASPVFRHRILTNFHAESERVSSEDLIDRLLEHVTPPQSGM